MSRKPALAVPALLAASGLAALLSGCAGLIDADQARVCRTIAPALNPAGSTIAISRVVPGGAPNSVRVFYRAQPPDLPARNRFVECVFAGDGLSRTRQDILRVSTENGPLSDASFLFLRRFFLAAPEAGLEDPGGLGQGETLPDVPMALAYGVQQVLSGLPQAGVYSLLAAAYSLIYGLVGRIVFGFGELAAIGGYACLIGVVLAVQFGWPSPLAGLAIAGAMAICAAVLHGIVLGRRVVAPLLPGPGLPILIATTGAMLAGAEYLRLAQGNDLRWIPPVLNGPISLLRSGGFVTTVTPGALVVTGVSLVAALALTALLRFSGFGRAWRAFADDPATAALFGVDPLRIFIATFGLAAGLAGLAGLVTSAYYGGVGYGAGLGLGLKALTAAVLGGIGSVGGGLLGGLLIGLAEALWSSVLPIEARDIFVYALLAIVLALRPGGLFGYGDALPRRI